MDMFFSYYSSNIRDQNVAVAFQYDKLARGFRSS